MRIAKIVKAVKAFANGSSQEEQELTGLKSIIEDAVEICRPRLKRVNVDLEVQWPVDSMETACRPVQIAQVIVNLIHNACDALKDKEGGKITITHVSSPEWIEISIADNGPGVPESIRNKIGRAFFTTKASGEGLGLGLNISKQIMESHKGHLFLDPESKQTRFVIRLPQLTNLREALQT